MNIIEALRSGKKFKKLEWPDWHEQLYSHNEEFTFSGSLHQWLSTDWEIEEDGNPVTETEQENAEALKFHKMLLLDMLAKQFGLKIFWSGKDGIGLHSCSYFGAGKTGKSK